MLNIRSSNKRSGRLKQGEGTQRRSAKVHVDSLGRRYVIPSEFIRSDEAQESLRQIRDFRRKKSQHG